MTFKDEGKGEILISFCVIITKLTTGGINKLTKDVNELINMESWSQTIFIKIFYKVKPHMIKKGGKISAKSKGRCGLCYL